RPQPLADRIEPSLKPAKRPPAAFVPGKFTRTSFYSSENFYRDYPKEGTYIACRGPGFTECYDRYAFDLSGVEGTVNVIAPKQAAAGNPRVVKADFVSRAAGEDLTLLAKGFHIVVGPVPYNADGPSRSHWDAVFRYLTEHGFSRKPVLEGAGGAAGEGYGGGIQNPDKGGGVYGGTPVLRSHMPKTPPLDKLAPLARAGVPLLHVCGSLDPWFNDQTRVAEKRYKELGGQITVIVKEGEGHFPTAPKDAKPVVDIISARAQ